MLKRTFLFIQEIQASPNFDISLPARNSIPQPGFESNFSSPNPLFANFQGQKRARIFIFPAPLPSEVLTARTRSRKVKNESILFSRVFTQIYSEKYLYFLFSWSTSHWMSRVSPDDSRHFKFLRNCSWETNFSRTLFLRVPTFYIK